MPKKYIIYRDENCFIFGKENANGEYDIIQNLRQYNRIITEFIKQGYTITYNDNKVITLKGKRKKNQDYTIISIVIDKRLMNCKYFKPLKESMKKVKKAKGYTTITIDENGKRNCTKYPGGLLKLVQERAAIFSLAITLVGFLMIYGFHNTKANFNHNNGENSSLNTNDKYSISMMDDSQINSASISENIHAPWNIDDYGSKIFPFQKSFLVDEDFLNSLIEERKNNYKLDPDAQTIIGIQEEIVKPAESEYDNHLKTYAEYFHLDSDKVIEFAKEITNNYTIPFYEVNGTTAYDIESKEASCLVFVHNLYRNNLAIDLSYYDLTTSYFIIDPSVTTLPPDKILANGQTFEQFFGHICDLLKVDKSWLLGITYLETGHLNSNLALYKNNFGGLRGSDGFYTYISPEAGIISHCRNLKDYESLGLQNIYELAGKYVFGRTSVIYEYYADPENETLIELKNTMDNWISSVEWFHNDFENRSEEIFGPTDPVPVSSSTSRG